MISLALLLAIAQPPAIVVPAVSRAALDGLIGADDYPASARAQGIGGTTQVLLDVGANGRVTGCSVRASSGTAVLDWATCRLLSSRARFTPAIDSTGARVADRVETSITWSPPR